MRPTILLAALGLAAALGCGQTRFNTVKNSDQGPVPNPQTATQLVAYLNDNAGRIQAVRADDLWITINANGEKFDVSGKMMAQKARGFRLKAKALGNEVVDLGSNDQEFWYWISK